MARINSDLGTVLTAVVDRIVGQGLCSVDCCYLSLDADGHDDVAPSSGEFVYKVSPLAGNFADQYLDGGGHLQAADFFDFVVTLYSTVQLDESGRDAEFLNDTTLGLLVKFRLLLKALTAHDLVASANNVLRDPIIPQGYVFKRPGRGLACVKLTCRVAFDWDLVT